MFRLVLESSGINRNSYFTLFHNQVVLTLPVTQVKSHCTAVCESVKEYTVIILVCVSWNAVETNMLTSLSLL